MEDLSFTGAEQQQQQQQQQQQRYGSSGSYPSCGGSVLMAVAEEVCVLLGGLDWMQAQPLC